jgi:hypothetical protein
VWWRKMGGREREERIICDEESMIRDKKRKWERKRSKKMLGAENVSRGRWTKERKRGRERRIKWDIENYIILLKDVTVNFHLLNQEKKWK